VEDTFPFNLPIWRCSHEALSPDGTASARMASATETSMGNPTSGELELSNGARIRNCSPAFLWSDCSRYVAVPQWRTRFGFRAWQRLLIIDLGSGDLLSSPPLQWWLMPLRFTPDLLTVSLHPTKPETAPRQFAVPRDSAGFTREPLLG
jgi:hypothetical protein